MQKHFVEFFSPGTVVAEKSLKPIDSWDVDQAISMSRAIKERHGSLPYGFQFITRGREPDELDSKIIEKSNMYYLGGKVFTIDEIRSRAYLNEKILLSNMECNKWKRVIINNNSWKWTQPLKDNDIVLETKNDPA